MTDRDWKIGFLTGVIVGWILGTVGAVVSMLLYL